VLCYSSIVFCGVNWRGHAVGEHNLDLVKVPPEFGPDSQLRKSDWLCDVLQLGFDREFEVVLSIFELVGQLWGFTEFHGQGSQGTLRSDELFNF